MTESGKTDYNTRWKAIWEEGRTPWHITQNHWFLENNLSKLTEGRKGLRVFIPLCGKAVELAWLAELGHSVVGVEISEKGVEEFFKEQGLTYTVSTQCVQGEDFNVYKAAEKPISIFCCDIFKFSRDLAGSFDFIWDRASLEALRIEQRGLYAAMIKNVLCDTGVYAICGLLFDHQSLCKSGGPPFPLPIDEIKRLYGDVYDVERLCVASHDEMLKHDSLPAFLLQQDVQGQLFVLRHHTN